MSVSKLSANEIHPATPGGRVNFTGVSPPTYVGSPILCGAAYSATLNSSASQTFTCPEVKTTSRIFLWPSSSTASTKVWGGPLFPVVTLKSNGSFQISSSNGAAFIGDETWGNITFEYLVVNNI